MNCELPRMDHEMGFILEKQPEQLPEDAQIDGRKCRIGNLDMGL